MTSDEPTYPQEDGEDGADLTPETLPEKWLTLPRAMRVWHAVALDPVRLLTLDVDHARQVLEAQANEVALIVERLQSSEQRLAEAEKLAAYGERQLRKEYEAEAGVEKLMADVIYHVPSNHRTFEAFVDERLAAFAGEKP